jgi:glyoxylase-like metal-dependent hydrolase (beta-lactamase superfamily II)
MTEVRELMPGIQIIVCGGLGPQNNIYLLETDDGLLMVDTSWLPHVQTILDGVKALGHRTEDVKTILLTHAHPDHTGGAAGLAQLTRAVVAVHEADAPVITGQRRLRLPPRPLRTYLIHKLGESQGVTYPTDVALWQPSPVKVNRLLRDGDMLGKWQVIHSPGHTPGNVSLYHAARKVLIAGNWIAIPLRQAHPEGGLRQARGPLARLLKALLNPIVHHFMDFEAMRASARRLAALEFETLLLSHGDPAQFPAFAAQLRAEYAHGK